MDFKVGDIVRIKGGVDEWRITSHTSGTVWIIRANIGFSTYDYNVELVRRKECEHGSWSTNDGGKTRRCVTCDKVFDAPKKKVERWLWVYITDEGLETNYCWRTEDEAKRWAEDWDALLIGKDPNCLNPLVIEE